MLNCLLLVLLIQLLTQPPNFSNHVPIAEFVSSESNMRPRIRGLPLFIVKEVSHFNQTINEIQAKPIFALTAMFDLLVKYAASLM